jgi:hypothetical protein
MLLAIGYWLLAIGYWLLAIGHWPINRAEKNGASESLVKDVFCDTSIATLRD